MRRRRNKQYSEATAEHAAHPPTSSLEQLGKAGETDSTTKITPATAPRYGAFPASRYEAEVVAALRSRFEDASANRKIPADMLFGFVRSNEPRGFRGGAAPANAAQEVRRWAEAAAKHLAEALALLETFQVRSTQRSALPVPPHRTPAPRGADRPPGSTAGLLHSRLGRPAGPGLA